MKRNLVFILLLFLSTTMSIAQFNRNNGRNTTQNNRPQKPPEFNPEKIVGLVVYKVDKVLKKIGVKKSDKNYATIVSELTTFNKNITQFSRIHSFTFSESKKTMEAAQKQATSSNNFSTLKSTYLVVGKKLNPILEQINEKEKILNQVLEPLLSKKQYDKWIKYKAKLKKV